MNPLDKLKQIKALVFNDAPQAAPVAPAPVQLMEYTLQDGTVVMIDKLEAGGVVMIGESPAPAGEHTLADGSKLTVSEGGVIASIEVPEAAPAEEDMNAQYTQRFEAMEQKLAGYETALSAVRQEAEVVKQSFARQEELNKKFIEMMETLVNEPSTQPTAQPNTFKKQLHVAKSDKIAATAGYISNILNKNKN